VAKDTPDTLYTILWRLPGNSDWGELQDDEGNPMTFSGRQAEAAVRSALKADQELAALSQQGDGVEVWAIPMRSRKPLAVKLVPQAPVIVIGTAEDA
jgi:hypothetical protein